MERKKEEARAVTARPILARLGRDEHDQAKLIRWLSSPPKKGAAKILHDALAEAA